MRRRETQAGERPAFALSVVYAMMAWYHASYRQLQGKQGAGISRKEQDKESAEVGAHPARATEKIP